MRASFCAAEEGHLADTLLRLVFFLNVRTVFCSLSFAAKKQFLEEQRQGLKHLTAIIKKDQRDLSIMLRDRAQIR